MLVKSLIANAIFSTSSAAVIFTYAAWLNEHIQMPYWIYLGIGIGLLLFAVQLILMAKLQSLREKLIDSVIVSDAAWVLITGGLAFGFSENISESGAVIIVSVNIIISLLAWFQYLGRRDLRLKGAN